MQSNEIRKRYLEFFKKRGHAVIPSSSLLPENDPSSLFITAGMQPLVPYLLGQKHPAGVRLVDVQKCIRTNDIEAVGDNRHLTFFEMLGNWSLGDYFKKESITWSMEFLTSKDEGLGLDPKRLYATVFRGENGIPRDDDSIAFWKDNFNIHNIAAEVADGEMISGNVRIIPLGVDDNFWIAGGTGPCGGDTEIFYDTVGGDLQGNFSELVKSGRIIEVWNNVFMEFNKTPEGKYEPLKSKNVDTGMGLERTAVVMQGKSTVFETDIFVKILSVTDKLALDERSSRIIADHFRASVFMIADGVRPSNTEAGYVLRRLLRRAVIKSKDKKINNISEIVSAVVESFGGFYNEIEKVDEIVKVIQEELNKFEASVERGLKELIKVIKETSPERKEILGLEAFSISSSYGLPIEIIVEVAEAEGFTVDVSEYNVAVQKHQEISKAGSEQKFKGGLASTGEMETKYHTSTHLLLASLRKVLNAEIVQKGSNITSERLRFDFNWPEKLTKEQIQAVEDMVNQKISESIPVEMLELPKEEAKKVVTTLSFDLSKYGDIVKVYKVGNFSTEFCGGPHVKNTSELGKFKIIKEEASSAGVRRIKATLS